MHLRRRVARASRRLLGRMDPVILMYHRVVAAKVDPWGLAVEPENFAAHMRVLKERRRPVPLDWLVDELLAGRRPAGAVAVTFDDAYRDVLENAMPVLVSLDIPATTFVVTGRLGAPDGFWWDRLASAVFRAACLPAGLDLSFVPPTERESVDAASGRGDVEALHLELWRAVRRLAPEQCEAAVEEVAAALGRPGHAAAPVMTPEEVLELRVHGEITIGAHTVSHPSLPTLSVDGQRAEMAESRRYLEELTNEPIERFAYPFGDFDARSEALAGELGFRCAVTVDAGAANDPRAIFRLPRHDIKNWSGPEFGKRLTWFG